MHSRTSSISLTAVVVLAGVAFACAPKQVPTPAPAVTTPAPPIAKTRVVLLKDTETNSVGRVQVSNAAGTVELRSERELTSAAQNTAPEPANTLSEAEMAQLFGSAIAALPEAPARFTLEFRLGTEDLTDESRAQVPDVVQAIVRRSTPYVTVVGHTDTSGKDADNFALGLTRAQAIRAVLLRSGLVPSSIEVLTLGERDPLVATPDGTPEPRNRRVEIAVR